MDREYICETNELLKSVLQEGSVDDFSLILLYSMGYGEKEDELEGAKKDRKSMDALNKLIKKGYLDSNYDITSKGKKQLEKQKQDLNDLLGFGMD